MKTRSLITPILALVSFPAFLFGGMEAPKTTLESYTPWQDDTVKTFENILVQQDGRVKPINTVARFTLLQFLGKSKVWFQTERGESYRVDYAAWLLDVLFRPQIANQLPVFVVDDSEVVVQIGVSPKSKRDRYSYNELLKGRSKLAELGAEFEAKEKKYRDSEKDPQYELERVEGMILTLARNVSSYEYLIGQFGFARTGEAMVNEGMLPPEMVELSRRLNIVDMVDKMPEMTTAQLSQLIRQAPGESEDEKRFSAALRLFFFQASSAQGIHLFPPRDSDQEEWLSGGDLLFAGLASKKDREWTREQLGKIQALTQALKKGEEDFNTALHTFSDQQHAAAAALGEGTHSQLEIRLYRGQWFINALYCFVLAFLLMAFSWMTPGTKIGKLLTLGAAILALVGFALDVYGITLRCIIRQRPPITNLYDTVLFISAIAVLLGLFIEYATRMGVGLLVAVLSGVLGMFLSLKYEAKEASDTINQLQAVLDTNFWLATHVTVINIGYAAGLVAAVIGILYLSGRFVGLWMRRENPDFYRSLTRMNYGVICFCLFFSFAGTVLGGIWANYSWGRFWGWDPKENGALMICLWTLVILHGRKAGWIREIGLHVNAIMLAIFTTFSWWGVNNLGVGLHSYGFTEGVWGALYTSWAVMAVFMLMGIPIWLHDTKVRQEKKLKSHVGKEAHA